uniref:Putative secretory peptide-59 n=1 Tax=Pleurobrachia bachei TaxID=34499 RepID=M4H2J0_PLEBA|nr:putative secretory peptide-59 [Pleurobrachia bachei]|eukprot:sb/3469483/
MATAPAVLLLSIVGLTTAAQDCVTLHTEEVPDEFFAVKSPVGFNFTGITTIKMKRGDRTKEIDEILWWTPTDQTEIQYRPMVLLFWRQLCLVHRQHSRRGKGGKERDSYNTIEFALSFFSATSSTNLLKIVLKTDQFNQCAEKRAEKRESQLQWKCMNLSNHPLPLCCCRCITHNWNMPQDIISLCHTHYQFSAEFSALNICVPKRSPGKNQHSGSKFYQIFSILGDI